MTPTLPTLNLAEWDDFIRRALTEDLGAAGDVTTQALVGADRCARAVIVARRDYVVAGGALAVRVLRALDAELTAEMHVADGGTVRPGQVLLTVAGRARAILTGERTALNLLQRLTGIATLTAQFVARARPYGVRILDTRKTTPLLRGLEKYAVACGGGTNHRRGLYDMILIKDNHRRLWARDGTMRLADAVRAARAAYPGLPVEVEVESEAELLDAMTAAPEWLLLDNMTPDQLKRCVALCARRCRLEASGGVTLETIEAVAASGVDAVSLGCLTHSAPAADLSLELTDDDAGAT